MNHQPLLRQKKTEGSSDLEFGLVFSTVFLILAILAYFSRLPFSLNPIYLEAYPFFSSRPELAAHALPILFVAISLIFLGLAFLFPKALAPLNWLWTKFGLLIHKIVSPVVLGILFFAVFTPFGVAIRLFGGDPLRLRFEPKAQSYWIERSPPVSDRNTLKDQF